MRKAATEQGAQKMTLELLMLKQSHSILASLHHGLSGTPAPLLQAKTPFLTFASAKPLGSVCLP